MLLEFAIAAGRVPRRQCGHRGCIDGDQRMPERARVDSRTSGIKGRTMKTGATVYMMHDDSGVCDQVQAIAASAVVTELCQATTKRWAGESQLQ